MPTCITQRLRIGLPAFAILSSFSAVAPAEITAEDVLTTITRGTRYLKEKQSPEGGWKEYANQPGGVTALAALALLNSGVPADDPMVRKSLNYLRRIGNPKKTYATALITMVLCAAEPQRDMDRIRTNVQWLESTQTKDGGWGYPYKTNSPDNSNAQFAILALHEAQRAGIKVKDKTWHAALRYWLKRQQAGGGWGYRGNAATGSMTCAGIGSVVICLFNLSGGDAFVNNGQLTCCGFQDDIDAVERAVNWLGSHFSVARNPSERGRGAHQFYYLYGLERVGRLTGRRFIGRHDWYREGAEYLTNEQKATASGSGWWRGSHDRVITTSFSLLFLAKGRRPVLVAKAQRVPDDDWNRHRRDVANLTAHVESLWEQDMTWQVIDLRVATVQDLLQTPVLFISGRDSLILNNKQKETLKEYVYQGGFIFAENCCQGQEFNRQFRALMKELFPDNPLRPLPPSHPVWYAERPVDPDVVRPLYGIEACCRTGVVYCPEDLGCFWELARNRHVQHPETIQQQMNGSLTIGANVLAYATNRVLTDKLDIPAVSAETAAAEDVDRGSLYVGKLNHGGGSDDAPTALMNLLRSARDQLRIPVNTKQRLVAATDPTLPDYPLLFMHGRYSFEWSATERKALRDYLENGGVLIADAICANDAFAEAFRRELKTILPNNPLKRIPANHAMFTDEYRGFDVRQVTVRRPSQRQADDAPLTATRRTAIPHFEGADLNGRYVVLFSPLDMSCALENRASMDCAGYIREDAAKLGINLLLYALQE